MDTWIIFTSSGEYGVTAPDLITAATQFTAAHPDDFIHAIVCDAMESTLIPNTDISFR